MNQARNPLHGITLEALLTELVAHYGWPGLAERIEALPQPLNEGFIHHGFARRSACAEGR